MARPKINQPCSANECTKPYFCTGLCRSHYNQQWRLISPGQLKREALLKLKRQQWRAEHPLQPKPLRFCSTTGCEDKYFSKGLCQYHANKEYREINKPSQTARVKKYKKEWYARNGERLAEERKQWWANLTQDEKDKRNIYHRVWQRAKYAKDPAGELLKVHARRTKTNGVKINKEDIHNWHSKICGICNLLIEDKFHIDHIIPLSRGGKHEVTNLQLAHALCNWSKNNRLQEEMNI